MKKIFPLIFTISLLIFLIGFFYAGGIISAWKKYPFDNEFQVKTKYLKDFFTKIRYVKLEQGLIAAFKETTNLEWKIIKGEEGLIYTGLHDLRVEYIDISDFSFDIWEYKRENDVGGLAGGYIEESDPFIIIVNGIGDLQILNKENKKRHNIQSNLATIIDQQKYYSFNDAEGDQSANFGMRDIFWDQEKNHLYVSFHSEIDEKFCYGLELRRAEINNWNAILNNNTQLDFKNFFKTKNCAKNFNGHNVGGRIIRYGDKIILTVGSFNMDEANISSLLSHNTDFGKILLIDGNGQSTIISSGHRNQQGLEIIDNKIFISEHGPMGGDEINKILEGANYGWPFASYGFEYDATPKYRMYHEPEFTEPMYYFTPSVAVSEIRYYNHEMFPRWKNNLFVSSLKDKSLYRLHYSKKDDRFISGERIEVGHRIRDMLIDADGSIWLITDDQLVIRISRSVIDIPNE